MPVNMFQKPDTGFHAGEPLYIPCFADVEVSAKRLEGIAHRTPVLTSKTADQHSEARLFFKCENFQRAGSFKFRGAYNAISRLSSEQKQFGVVAYSSGNHGQALAYAGRLQGVGVTIVMPSDAPALKIAATNGYGAKVVTFDRYTGDRDAIVAEIAAAQGANIIPPFDHADVIAGQGTAALELISEVGSLDMLFVCLGGGGLLAGSALAAKRLSPDCQVIGVEPEAGNDGQQSFRSGQIVKIPVPRSIADGALTTALGQRTFPVIRSLVSDIVTVSDDELVQAMRFFAERMKMVVEPTGCLAAAAAMTGKVDVRGKRVGVIISGGNVDLAAFAGFIG